MILRRSGLLCESLSRIGRLSVARNVAEAELDGFRVGYVSGGRYA